MTFPTNPPVPPQAFVEPKTGRLRPEAYRFLFQLNQSTGEAAAGEVGTAAGSGLEGGGAVSGGVDLAISPNGVSNAMLAQVPACSVKGRYANSTGNAGDITAVTDNSCLTRTGDQLGFNPFLDAIPVGLFTAAPSVQTDSLQINQTPTAEVVVCTHTVVINIGGTDYKFPCVAA